MDFQSFGVVVIQIATYFLDKFVVVRAEGIQPEDSRSTCSSCTAYGELYPVLYGCIFHLAHTPNVASFYLVREIYLAMRPYYAYFPVFGNFKSFVMRTIFLGFLRHKSYIGHRTHSGRVESSIFFAEVYHNLIHSCITTVG